KKEVFHRLQNLGGELSAEIIGQEEAVDAIQRIALQKLTGVGSDKKGHALLFFGPPGTGKTMSSKIAAQKLGLKSRVIEMNKYANGDIEAFRHEVFLAL